MNKYGGFAYTEMCLFVYAPNEFHEKNAGKNSDRFSIDSVLSPPKYLGWRHMLRAIGMDRPIRKPRDRGGADEANLRIPQRLGGSGAGQFCHSPTQSTWEPEEKTTAGRDPVVVVVFCTKNQPDHPPHLER